MNESTSAPRARPRIELVLCPGTLPSVGKDRMDLLRYRQSGIARLTGEELLAPLPEAAAVAQVQVAEGTCRLSARATSASSATPTPTASSIYTPGMVVADTLSPQKAALLLALALTRTRDPEEIQRVFDEY